VFDAVPLAGSGRQVGDGDSEAGFVGEVLQFDLPQGQARTFAATAIGGNQQAFGGRVSGVAEGAPPATDAFDSEGGSVVVDAEIDPAGVGGDVVDPVGHCLAEFGDAKIVDADGLGIAFAAQLAPAILKSPTSSFFLVSTEIAGSPSVKAAATAVLIYSN
jgi:hypothetical protein